MQSAAEFLQSHFDLDVFFSTYWRRKPLFVRGGADALAGRRWREADFQAVLAAAKAADHPVHERAGEVTFIEMASNFDNELAARASALRATFGAPQVWFDTVRTYCASGIGAHFDHSDNFVLQQDGIKEWTLASPAHIAKADLARRMMNVSGVGAHDLPDDGRIEFTLQPGDLLYIPMFWLHSGVSEEGSLSLSLVCPAVSLYAAVIPLLVAAAKSRALGHQPIPALHSRMSTEERLEATAALRQATRTLVDRLTDEDLLDAVAGMQRDRLPGLAAVEAQPAV